MMIFLILNVSKDAENHHARTFAEVSLAGEGQDGGADSDDAQPGNVF